MPGREELPRSRARYPVRHGSARQYIDRSRVYEEKIAYLELQLAELGTLAQKQDEELKTIESNTRNARADVERTRRIRSAAALKTKKSSPWKRLGDILIGATITAVIK